ncbi:ER membrane protein complex subunit 8/9 homolog [Onthophagus taurus]|uniref:ER membrane protein complex subunit 8/9 homolog n=1 Tax=Onthophagus taurus TaxID=166361 RepID=UPI000C209C31|nr:ER membrane protein complex subunit 8/9 homolog [Onthophagus taurus]
MSFYVKSASFKMTELIISARAYCKIILHAAKYGHCSINGVLLAKPTKGKDVEFVDAIPLFHVALNLTPMAEIALTEIDQYANQLGLVIAGYYTAHENLKECSIEKANHKIAEKVAENFPSACMVIVENHKLNLKGDNAAIKVAQYSDGKYRQVDVNKVSLAPKDTLGCCSQLLKERAYSHLIDFDNHLDDITEDWKNEYLNDNIDRLI